jgi:hypothetical protein
MRAATLKLITGGLLLAGVVTTPVVLLSQSSQPPAQPATPPAATAPQAPAAQGQTQGQARPTDNYDSQAALAELKKAIAGKEEQPAETVYKNIQMFKGVPAARVLGAMNAFSNALGVTCRKCHDVQNWASDDKHEKTAARNMMRMTGDINEKYLKGMAGLDDDDAHIGCGTCHRGHAHPESGMQRPAGAPGGPAAPGKPGA